MKNGGYESRFLKVQKKTHKIILNYVFSLNHIKEKPKLLYF